MKEEDVNDRWIIGILAIFCGLCYIVGGITHFLMPSEQLHFSGGADSEFFISLIQEASAFHVHYWVFVIASLAAIGVVAGIRIQDPVSLWFRFVSILAIVAFALTAIDFARMHAQAVRMAGQFSNASPAMREVIASRGIDRLDGYGISFNMVGLWLITLCCTALRARTWPVWISGLGILNGILLQWVLIGTVMHSDMLIDLAAGLSGVILTPVLFFSFGVIYLKKKEK
jgi:hypothetical protein